MAKIKKVSIYDPAVKAYRDVEISKAKFFVDFEDELKTRMDKVNGKIKAVSIYDPFVHAYREVTKEYAKLLLDEIKNARGRIKVVEED